MLPVPSRRQTRRLIDVRLSETRVMKAAKAFFKKVLTTADAPPEKVTTDGHDAYPRAVKEELGEEVQHRTSRYLNNKLERSQRYQRPVQRDARLQELWFSATVLRRFRRTEGLPAPTEPSL